MNEILLRLQAFNDDRDWGQFHTPSNLAKSIMIEAAELLEHFQWFEEAEDLEGVKDELADVMLYCLRLAQVLELDLVEILNQKMDKNEIKYPIEKAYGNSKKYTDY